MKDDVVVIAEALKDVPISELDRRIAAIPQEHLNTLAEALRVLAEEGDNELSGDKALLAAATVVENFPALVRAREAHDGQ